MINILPPHFSELEKRLEIALSRIENIEVLTSEIWNADTCPVEVLPYLAWSLSVDIWDENWDEETKRRVINNSIFIHKHKGTRPAVERAVESIRGDTVEIVEWFDDRANLDPGEFSISVVSSSGDIDITQIRSVVPVINSAKNARSHFANISVTSRTNLNQNYAVGSLTHIHIKSGQFVPASLRIKDVNQNRITANRNTIYLKSGPL